MASLQDIRQKYPQYADMPDGELADRLHAKFYSDMPREEFDAKIGFSRQPAYVPEGSPTTGFAGMTEAFEREQDAAAQRTSPVVRDYTGAMLRKPLGEAVEADYGTVFKGPDGKYTLVNPQANVILTDPATGKRLVFERTEDTNESTLLSLFRTMAPGFMTNPVSRIPGGVAQATAAAAKAPSRMKQVVQAFDRTGVAPSLPAATESNAVGRLANTLKDTPVGFPIQKQVAKNIDEASGAVDRLADTVSPLTNVDDAGRAVQQGARTSLDQSAARFDELYGQVVDSLPDNITSRMPNAQVFIRQYGARIKNPAIAEVATNDRYNRVMDAVMRASKEGANIRDLRTLRTAVRGLKDSQESMVGLDRKAIDDLYSAITRDMLALAKRAGGDRAVRGIQQVDDAYRLYSGGDEARGIPSTKAALEKIRDAKSAERAYASIFDMASSRRTADIRQLNIIKRSMPQSEWNDFVGVTLRNMGRATPGAVTRADDATWSPATFITNYERLSDKGRTSMFGDAGLRRALDDLLTVASELKRVQKLGNPSGSGHVALQGALLGGAAVADLTTTATLGGVGLGLSKLMSSPAFVRWLSGAYRIEANALKRKGPGRELALRQLLSHWQKLRSIPFSEEDKRTVARILGLLPASGEAYQGQGQ